MKLVCLGDSITYGYGVEKHECFVNIIKDKYNIEVINKGINGDTTSNMLFRVYEDAIILKPTHILVMGGTNDFLMGYKESTAFENLKCIIDDIKNHEIKPIVGIPIKTCSTLGKKYWSSFIDYSVVNEKLNSYKTHLIKYCKDNHIPYFNFYDRLESENLDDTFLYLDGIHPNKIGHSIMAKEIVL